MARLKKQSLVIKPSVKNLRKSNNSPEVKNPKNAANSTAAVKNPKTAARSVKNPKTSASSAVSVKNSKKVARYPAGNGAGKVERSAYFARREAAKVLRTVLQGDANKRAVGSIKSLVYSPTVRNKRATFALLVQTLKYLTIIKDVLSSAGILNSKWKRQGELIYIITYDILFGQEASLFGDAEKFLLLRKDALESALAQLLVKKGLKSMSDLMTLQDSSDLSKPRYVRVNTLKMDSESALDELSKEHKVLKDDMVPDLLLLPPTADLHKHPLVVNGSVFLQSKASSMAAAALHPEPGWDVIDACAAPGNKTVHLSALMRGKGKIIACELNKDRVQRLRETVKLAGASNVEVLHGDFLNIDPQDPSYSKVRGILLDPSCSGSGTTAVRLDHLLPSHGADDADTGRIRNLQAFQKKVLGHALSFPAVEKLVYSTCSIHQIENEDVIKSVLPLASSLGFQLATPFSSWPRRGLPVVEGSEHLLRTDPVEDKEGFFIALFGRKISSSDIKTPRTPNKNTSKSTPGAKRSCEDEHCGCEFMTMRAYPRPLTRLSKMMLHHHFGLRRVTKHKNIKR